MESLLIKLKRMKYHLTEIGAKVILFEHIYGNGKNVLYGHIEDINYVNGIKKDVCIHFTQDGADRIIHLDLFNAGYELIKMVKLQSYDFMFDSTTYAEMFIKSLELNDEITLIRYNCVDGITYDDVKVSGFKLRTFYTSQTMFYRGRNNKPSIVMRAHSCATGITPGCRSVIGFVLFKKLESEDKIRIEKFFEAKLENYKEITSCVIQTTFKGQQKVLDEDKKFNKFMREYNTKIVFDYLKDIIPEEDI